MSTSPHSLPYNNDRLLLFGEGEGFSFFGFISLLIFGDWLGIPVATGIADGCTILQLVGHGSQARWGVWPIAPLDVVRLRALGYRYWFSCLAGKLCYGVEVYAYGYNSAFGKCLPFFFCGVIIL